MASRFLEQETGSCATMVIPECPAKAAEFDKKHGLTGGKVKNAKKHAGAKELAEQYTPGLSVATGQGVVRAYVAPQCS